MEMVKGDQQDVFAFVWGDKLINLSLGLAI